MPFTNYAILIPSNYGDSRSPREFPEPCWGALEAKIIFDPDLNKPEKVFMGHLVNMGKYPDLLKFSFSL